MPLLEVTLAEGRTPAQIRALIHELHEAVVRAIDAAPSSVRVIVREVPTTHWAAGEDGVAQAAGDLAERHAGHERQRVVGLQYQPVPDVGAAKVRLAGDVHRQIMGNEDHDVPPDGLTTVFSKVPRPSMLVRTTSPARR